jgi:predicted glycosyltransferase
VLVPRARPSVEQVLRARKLAQWNVAQVIQPDQLDDRQLAAAIHTALSMPGPPQVPVSLTGVREALDVFDRLLGARDPEAADRGGVPSRAPAGLA